MSVEVIQLDPADKVHLQKDLLTPAVNTNSKKGNPAAIMSTREDVPEKRLLHTKDIKMGNDVNETEQNTHNFKRVLSSRQNVIDHPKSPKLKRRLLKKELDPLSSFMILRSQQALEAVTPLSSDMTEGAL